MLFVAIVLLAALVGFAVGLAGSALLGVITGILCLSVALLATWSVQRMETPTDPSRRRLLALAAVVGTAAATGGAVLGRTIRRVTRPDPRPIQETMASGARRRIHGAGRACLPPGPERRPAAPGRPVQQRELPAGVAFVGAARSPHEPRERLDVPRTDPPRGLRRRGPTLRLGGACVPRRRRPDDRRADRFRRVPGPRARGPSVAGDLSADGPTGDRRDVRDRRRRVERPARVPGRLAQPEAADAARERRSATRSTVRSPPSRRRAHATIGTGAFPRTARHHGTQPARRHEGSESLRRVGARGARRHPRADARRPVERRHRRPSVGR